MDIPAFMLSEEERQARRAKKMAEAERQAREAEEETRRQYAMFTEEALWTGNKKPEPPKPYESPVAPRGGIGNWIFPVLIVLALLFNLLTK